MKIVNTPVVEDIVSVDVVGIELVEVVDDSGHFIVAVSVVRKFLELMRDFKLI